MTPVVCWMVQESRFPFTELPFDGIFGLGLGGLSVCSSVLVASLQMTGSYSWSLIVDQLSLFELVVPWNPDFLKHLILLSVFDWLSVSFRGWTFLQFCQPFSRRRPKKHSNRLAFDVRPLAGKASNEAIRNPTFAFFLRSLDAWHLDRYNTWIYFWCEKFSKLDHQSTYINIQVVQKFPLLSSLVWWEADEDSEITFGGYRPERLEGAVTWLPVSSSGLGNSYVSSFVGRSAAVPTVSSRFQRMKQMKKVIGWSLSWLQLRVPLWSVPSAGSVF